MCKVELETDGEAKVGPSLVAGTIEVTRETECSAKVAAIASAYRDAMATCRFQQTLILRLEAVLADCPSRAAEYRSLVSSLSARVEALEGGRMKGGRSKKRQVRASWQPVRLFVFRIALDASLETRWSKAAVSICGPSKREIPHTFNQQSDA